MELIVIGTTQFLPGFALAGVRKTILANEHDVMVRVNEHRDAAIIILDEKLTISMSAAQREELETSVSPIIIILSTDGKQDRERLRRSIMATLGVDLLKA